VKGFNLDLSPIIHRGAHLSATMLSHHRYYLRFECLPVGFILFSTIYPLWRLLVTLQSLAFSELRFYLVSLTSIGSCLKFYLSGCTVTIRVLQIKSLEHHLNASTGILPVFLSVSIILIFQPYSITHPSGIEPATTTTTSKFATREHSGALITQSSRRRTTCTSLEFSQ
jgi:hypothetical protein